MMQGRVSIKDFMCVVWINQMTRGSFVFFSSSGLVVAVKMHFRMDNDNEKILLTNSMSKCNKK